MVKKRRFAYILLTAIVSLATIGFSTWINNIQTADDLIVTERDPNTKKVCYIKGDTEENNRYFTTIEKALEVSSQNEINDNIYVIPGTNPIISRTCTIDTRDSLYIPYEGETFFSQVHSDYDKGGLGYLNESKNRKNLITIKNNVSFNVLGKLFIGGIQSGGSGGAYYSGHTCLSYTEIHLQKGARITSFGEITSYGYISGTLENDKPVSKISFENGSVTYIPFIVREHRGGSIFLGMAGKDSKSLRNMIMKMLTPGTKVQADLQTSPFNRFLLNNFYNIEFDYNFGSKLIGKASMFADNQPNNADVGLIGNSQEFFVNTLDKTLVNGFFHKDKEKCYLNIFGSVNITSLKLQLHVHKEKAGITVDGDVILSTANILFPLSHYFDISLNKFKDGSDAVVNCQQQSFKVLPSTNLYVNEGVNLIVKKLFIYEYSDFYPNGSYIVTGNVGTGSNYEEIRDEHGNYIESKVVNNGVLTVDELGGTVLTSEPSGILSITKSSSLISKEIISTEPAEITILGKPLQTYSAPIYLDINKSARGYVDSLTNLADLSVRTYTSGGQYWESIEREYNINYYKIVDENLPISINVPNGNPVKLKSSQLITFVEQEDINNEKYVGYFIQDKNDKYEEISLESKGSKYFGYIENGALNIYIKYTTKNRAVLNFYDDKGKVIYSTRRLQGDIIDKELFESYKTNDFESVKLNENDLYYDLIYNYSIGWAIKNSGSKIPITKFDIPNDITDLQNFDFEVLLEQSFIDNVFTITDSSDIADFKAAEGSNFYEINNTIYYPLNVEIEITVYSSFVGTDAVLVFADGTSNTYNGTRGDQKYTNILVSMNAELKNK